MKKYILFLLLAISLGAEGLDNLELGGYLESKTSLMFSEDELFSDYATVRLEGAWNFGKRGGIETHVLFTHSNAPLDPNESFKEGSVMERIMMGLISGPLMMIDSMGLMDSTLLGMMAGVDLDPFIRYLPYSSFYPKDKAVLDRALLKLYFKKFDLFIGRQMIAWGTGYGFNPTDVWNQKSPIDPTAPKMGVNAIRAEIPFGSVSGLTLVASPGADLKLSSAGFRFKGNLGGFDFSFSGMRVMNADRQLLGLPPKIIAGFDCAGQIGSVGVWAEAAAINPKHANLDYTDVDSLYAQIDAGLDYNFPNGLYFLLEYYYNGLGRHDSKDYSAREYMSLFGGDAAGFGQNYVMVGLRKDFLDYFNATLFGLGNLNDQSAMLIPGIEYSFHDNLAIDIKAQIGIGDEEKTEYGGVYSSGVLTVTGFF